MKAVLFDFGGTIDTDGVHWSEKFWEYYTRFDVKVPKPDFERAFVASERELAEIPVLRTATFYETLQKQFKIQFKLLALNGKDERLRSMVDACYADVDSTVDRAKPLIEKLAMRYRLGGVSDFYGNLETVCQEFKLYTSFNAVIDSVVVGLRKPDPAIWELALKKVGVKPEDAWVVGDSYERDIVPPKNLGCHTIWLRGKSWSTPPSTVAADHTILKFSEIEAILL